MLCSAKSMRAFPLLLISFSCFALSFQVGSAVNLAGTPNIQDSIQSPVAVVEGENAPLTCVVRELGSATVVWKKWETGKSGPKILTAGETRVTSDERIKIIHDIGGDVWVLAIRSAQPSDSGLYICEVNTTPVLRSFHNLTVVSLSIQPPNGTFGFPSEGGSEDIPFEESYSSYKGMGSIVGHNYTACCMAQNVSKGCLGFCTLQSILDGNTGEPTQCENEFSQIVKCMADGRDHVPCCVREGVPDICQDLCRGEYTTVTDNVKTHFSCPSYIERTLSCIADGVEILPSQPLNVEATAISSSSINVTWSLPSRNGDTVHEYVVNVTTLRSFDAPFSGLGYGEDPSAPATTTSPVSPVAGASPVPATALFDLSHSISAPSASAISSSSSFGESSLESRSFDENNFKPPAATAISAEDKVEAKMMQINVHGDLNSTMITNLKPFTMYEITVTAFNIHGRSLPSVKVRTLTLAPGLSRPKTGEVPAIPDIKSCCRAKGVNTPTCVTKLCDPKMTTQIEIPDLMICAPWTADVFTCLADGKDHTPCCRERGIPSPCNDLCTGNITRLDYHYFKCLRYMDSYTNCLMDGYGVLPSAPRQLRVSNVNEDFAIIHWSAPTTLADTVTGYNVHYRPMSTYENEYKVAANIHPPYILENLYSNAEYEVYVDAVNVHGISQSSQRVVFRTASVEKEVAELDAATQNYNETACCVKVGLTPDCLPLCSYDASMSDIRALALTCAHEFHTLLRCAAGGRDHRQCCGRRGVSENCLDVCNARVPDSLLSMAEECLPFIGNIVQCFEEGTEIIPGPATEFHIDFISDDKVTLSWEAPEDSNVTGYEVHYDVSDPTLARDLAPTTNSINVTGTRTEINNLTTGATYKFYVVSFNEHGSSVPSSVILVNVSASSFNGTRIPGLLSPPHSLVVATHTSVFVQIVWQPPVFAHPTDKITYRVYHRSVKETVYQTNETTVNSITLDQLKPNSQYIVYVTAVNNKGESPPSETLIAWTDPAHSPFVEPPRIQPSNMLIEGRAMTVVCVALGDPPPTISLYINGKQMKQQKNRHLTYVVENITREMDLVSCYADNGYGTPMQAARRIQVSHKPSVSGPDVTYTSLGDTTVIECTVSAHPDPKVVFWRNEKERVPIVTGTKYNIETEQKSVDLQSKYKLRISNVTEQDQGSYSCVADNVFGDDKKTFQLQIRRPQDASGNISACCQAANVSPECIDACNYFMDIGEIINKPQCLPDFDKLMRCSSDGRDHRACCSSWGVPKRCLDWCRGEPLGSNGGLCVLQNTPSILKCFHENRDQLPGPPLNVRVEIISENEVKVLWDPPQINPHKANIYRVFWRQMGEKMSQKIDTNETSVRIKSLKAGIQYETVIKAGNSQGTSVLTPHLLFYTEDNAISSAHTGPGSSAGLGIGISFLVILIVVGAVGAVWFLRKRQFAKPPGAIAFENPSYIRETNPDSMHVNGDGPVTGNGTAVTVPSVSNGVPPTTANGWHTEVLHPPRTETEVSPTLYEELRLGSEGAGFRRLR